MIRQPQPSGGNWLIDERSSTYRYGLAIVAVAVAIVTRAVLDPVLGQHAPMILFLLPVMIAALFGGARAGLLATLLGGFAGFLLFVNPRGDLLPLLPVDLVRAVLFFGEGILASVLIGSRRRGWEAAAAIAADLRDNERQLSALVNQASAGFCMRDPAGRIVRTNQRFRDLVGRSEAELAGLYLSDVIHPEDAGAELARFARLVDESRPYQVEERLVRPDGTWAWVSAEVYPLRSTEQAIDGAISVVLDVTERKLAEERLRESDRRKDEFLATLAHELRNPLAPIRTSLEFMKLKMPADSDLAKAWEIADRQSRHMTHLVDDLLDLSRISRGQVDLRLERIDLVDVIEHAIEATRGALENARHRLSVNLPERPCHLQGDPVRLSQVFTNLLSNAIKFTPSGGRIAVSAAIEGAEAIVRLKDSGIGIPLNLRERVFEMFGQADAAGEAGQEGLGIGLTLAEQLVSLHGGCILVSSDGEGRGSEFTVRLPLPHGEGAASA
jgi:PAS domain S-box-containing protein